MKVGENLLLHLPNQRRGCIWQQNFLFLSFLLKETFSPDLQLTVFKEKVNVTQKYSGNLISPFLRCGTSQILFGVRLHL